MSFCWCALVLLTLVPVVTGNHAGVKVKLTRDGLNYVADNAIKKMIKHFTFPDKSFLCNEFTGIQIQSWGTLNSVLTFHPTTGVTITIDSTNLHITGNWKIKNEGPFELTLSTLKIIATVEVKTDETGHLTLSMKQPCDLEMGRFSGNSGWEKALKGCLNGLRSYLKELMRSIMEKSIADVNTMLGKLNDNLSVYSGVYFWMGPTVISSDSIEFSLKDMSRRGHQEETGLSPTDFTLPSENTQMLYIGISAFTINSLAAAFKQSGFLSNMITDDMDFLLIGTNIQFQKNT